MDPELLDRHNGHFGYRNKALRDLGYKSYGKYLKSRRWRRIRRKVLERDDWTCYICGGDANQVHHEFYSKTNLRGEKLSWMHAICHPCHAAIEFYEDGNKVLCHKKIRRRAEMRRLDFADHEGEMRPLHEILSEDESVVGDVRGFLQAVSREDRLWLGAAIRRAT